MIRRGILGLMVWSSFASVALAQASKPQGRLLDGDMVAICGDSITEQKLYSVMMEDYFLMCQPPLKLRAAQFGWGGERAPGLLSRLSRDVLTFDPTVATTCYGMNDGGYGPMTEDKGKQYRDATKGIVQKLKAGKVRFIVVGSPGVVDTVTFKRSGEGGGEAYNKTLAALRDIAREVADGEGVAFANVHDAMLTAMTKAKAKYGPEYHVGGGDGIHPAANGQLVMAYAFLKALGCDGHIGTITLNLGADQAEATAGHKILTCQKGAVEVESTRYPFCFSGDPKNPGSTAGIIEFIPFNEELNRFLLVVTNPGAPRIKVTWGKETKEFSADQAAKGINLAAEFLDNPFTEQFRKVEAAIQQQQQFETPFVKSLLTARDVLPEEKEAFDRLIAGGLKKDAGLAQAAAALVGPVKHTLRVEAVK